MAGFASLLGKKATPSLNYTGADQSAVPTATGGFGQRLDSSQKMALLQAMMAQSRAGRNPSAAPPLPSFGPSPTPPAVTPAPVPSSQQSPLAALFGGDNNRLLQIMQQLGGGA